MSSTIACTGQLKDSDSVHSQTLDGSSDSEYVTAPLEPDHAEDAATTSTTYVTSVEEQIESSKSHWSEVSEFESDIDPTDEEAVRADNMSVFADLQKHPIWGTFFVLFTAGPRIGQEHIGQMFGARKFAEGGQGDLFHVKIRWWNPDHDQYDRELGREWVLKVFKKGTLLRHLQSQWPEGMLRYYAERMERSKLKIPALGVRVISDVYYGTILEDGRFAFLMRRESADLRTLLDDFKKSQGSTPFWRSVLNRFKRSDDLVPYNEGMAESIMCWIALGMDWLHSRNIVHRDLKASNVLFFQANEAWSCFIADYECSVGVIGTGFFRAPEILQACKDNTASSKPGLFTKAADAYSYGMTCYEILTGNLPFQDLSPMNYDVVLGGKRPEVPTGVDKWIHELLNWCWQSDPAARPTFGEILDFLEANSTAAARLRSKIRNIVPEKNPFVS